MSEEISNYWKIQRVFLKQDGRVYDTGSKYLNKKGIFYGCNECCNGDRCDDPTHRYRKECPYCLGTGQNATSERLNKEKIKQQ